MKSLGKILTALNEVRENGLAGAWQLHKRNRFLAVTFHCMGQLAKAKGRVTEADIAAATDLMRRLRLSDDQQAAARRCFRAGKSAQPDTAWRDRELHHHIASDSDQRQLFMQCQLQLAYADDFIGSTDRALIRQWAGALGMGSDDLRRIHKQTVRRLARQRAVERERLSQPMTPEEARAVLDVSESDARDEIKRRYQRAMSRYHPDKRAGRPTTTQEREEADARVRQLREAWDVLRNGA